MSSFDIDRWLRRVWLVNGIALLLLVTLGLGFAGFTMLSDARGDKAAEVAAPTPGAPATADRVRAVRFDVPATMRGTTTRIVLVRNGQDYLDDAGPRRTLGSGGSEGSADRGGPTVNVIFLPGAGAPGRLLFDRPVYVHDVSYPGKGYGADSLQRWVTYEVALDDTNGDGKLDESDRRDLFVSDLEGGHLTRVLPSGWRLEAHESMHDGRSIVITALEAPKPGTSWDERRALERAFLYDVPAAKLQPFAALDSLVVQAGRLVASPPRR